VTSTARAVFPVMGTMTSIVVADSDTVRLGTEQVGVALRAAQQELELVDRRFSHYSPDSDITRWLAGGTISPDAVAEFDYVLRQCGRLRQDSRGVFTVKNPMTGTVDTAGYVKGYGIRRAAEVMRSLGLRNFLLTVGGDTYCAGRPSADRPWRVAVADPRNPRAIAALVEVSDAAVATSGTSERGDHIWTAVGPAPRHLLSFTVIGPDIAEADAFATIGFAMGEAGVAWVAGHEGYRSMAIRPDGSIIGDAALVSAA